VDARDRDADDVEEDFGEELIDRRSMELCAVFGGLCDEIRGLSKQR